MTSESQERMLAIVEPDEPRRGARVCAAVGDPRDGRRARHRHRALPRLRRPVRRGRCARREPRPPIGDRPPVTPTRRRSPTCRSRASATVRCTTARSPRPPARTRCRPPIPAARCATSSPRRRPLRRAARAARDADDRRQDLGLAPVRPPAVPQHGRRSRRRRGGAAREGHDEGARARRPTARRASAASTRAPAAGSSVLEAARNVACSGARPIALVNCLNFGNPEHPEVMWQFSEVVEGMSEACEALGFPVIGGNVSFYNASGDDDIHPTPVVGRARADRRARRAAARGALRAGRRHRRAR